MGMQKLFIQKVLMQLSTSLIGRVFFLKMSFKLLFSVSKLEEPKKIERFQYNKVKTRPITLVVNETDKVRIYPTKSGFLVNISFKTIL